MPEIFQKEKLTLIEYGSQQHGLENVAEIKDKIVDFLNNIVK